MAVAVLLFKESFAIQRGQGYLIMDAWGRMDYVDMFIGILGMSLLGAALYGWSWTGWSAGPTPGCGPVGG